MHYRSEEQLAQMTYESFIEHLAKRYAIKESEVYGIIRWAESRMECMNPAEFSNMKNNAAMYGKYRKTLERHVEDHCARSSWISRWLMKCKKMDLKDAYSRPWG